MPHATTKVAGALLSPSRYRDHGGRLRSKDSRSGEPGRYIDVADSNRRKGRLALLLGHMVSTTRAGHRQLPERRHLPGAAPRVAGAAGFALPGVRHGDPLVRQYPGGQLAASARPVQIVPHAHRCPVPSGRGDHRGRLPRGVLAHRPVGQLPLAWAFIAVVIVLAFINHDHSVIPNRIVFPAVVCGLAAVHRPRPPALVAVRCRLPWSRALCPVGVVSSGPASLASAR